MAINYYVSNQRGNDSNDGLSQEFPFLTIGKAILMVTAGSIVYIGSGCYKERITLQTAGSTFSKIYWMPDFDSKYLTDDKSGIIRITGCDENEQPTSGIVWNFNGKNYNYIGNTKTYGRVYIDGSSDNYALYMGGTTTTYGYGVVATSYNGIYSGHCENCISMVANIGFSSNINYDCISISGNIGFNLGFNMNCISMSGNYGFFGSPRTDINSTAIGCMNGFYTDNAVSTSTNCLSLNSQYGFNMNSLSTLNYCRAINCITGFYGTSTTNVLNTSTCSAIYCSGKQRTTGFPTPVDYYETVEVSNAKHYSYYPVDLIKALMPILEFNYTGGSNLGVGYSFYDIMGNGRALIDGICHYGAHEFSRVSMDFNNYHTYVPSIKVERAGMQKFTFFTNGGEEFRKSVWVKWINVADANKPRITVKSTGYFVPITVTATSDGTNWEYLLITATPTGDCEVELYLYAVDTGENAVVYFSDLN